MRWRRGTPPVLHAASGSDPVSWVLTKSRYQRFCTEGWVAVGGSWVAQGTQWQLESPVGS